MSTAHVPALRTHREVLNDATEVFFLTTPAECAAHGEGARGVPVPKSAAVALSPFLATLSGNNDNDDTDNQTAVVPCESVSLFSLRLVAWYLLAAGTPSGGSTGDEPQSHDLGAAQLPRPFEQEAVHDAACLTSFERTFAAAVFGPLAAGRASDAPEQAAAALATTVSLLRAAQLLQVAPLSLLCGCGIAVRWNATGGAAAASAVTAEAVVLLETWVESDNAVADVEQTLSHFITDVETSVAAALVADAAATAPPPSLLDATPRPSFHATVTAEPAMADVVTPGINAVPRAECIDPFVSWNTGPLVVQWDESVSLENAMPAFRTVYRGLFSRASTRSSDASDGECGDDDDARSTRYVIRPSDAQQPGAVDPLSVTYDLTAWDMTEVEDWEFCGAVVGKLIFPGTLVSLGDGAFCNCCATVDLSRCTQLTRISKEAFASFEGRSIVFPPSITSMEESAFQWCRASVDLRHCTGLTSVPKQAFEGFEGDEVRLPPSITTLGFRCFYKCNTSSVDLSDCAGLTHLEDEVFAFASRGTLTMPASLRSSGFYAFMYVTGDTVIDLSRCSQFRPHDSTFTMMSSGTVIVPQGMTVPPELDGHPDITVQVASTS